MAALLRALATEIEQGLVSAPGFAIPVGANVSLTILADAAAEHMPQLIVRLSAGDVEPPVALERELSHPGG